jgi:predicted Zn-dependent peptidase
MDMEGNYYNAFTTLNRTEYILESTGENLLPALSCFLDLILEPAFDPAEVAIEKKIVTVEKALRDTPGNLFLTYLNHLTQNQLTSKIEAIDRRHVLAFHRQHYTVDQLTVIITGNFEAAEIAAYLAALPKPQTPDPRPQQRPNPPLLRPRRSRPTLFWRIIYRVPNIGFCSGSIWVPSKAKI